MLLRQMIIGLFAMLATASPGFAQWHEAKTRHFIIYSQQGPRELQSYAERLERFDTAVRLVRRMPDPVLTDGAKVTIYVLPTLAALQRLAEERNRNRNIYGFYLPRASGSVAFVTDRINSGPSGLRAEEIFQHEYIHHLMLSDQAVPYAAWQIEGYAEFFGTAQVQRDGSVKIGLAPQSRGWSILNDIGFSAEDLLGAREPKTDAERSSVYGKGWLLTHLLTFSKTRGGQLNRYIEGLTRGERPLDAARVAFGDLKQLDREMDRYARGSISGVQVPPGPAPTVAVRRMTAGESAIMSVRIRSDRGVNRTTAPQVAEDARRIAAAHPTDAFVQGVLAETEYDVRNYTAAIAAADRALGVAPANIQALIYKGRAMMALARAAPAKADWPEVRRQFVRANRADTENAEPLYLFYQSFAAAGQQPTKAAIEGLIYAQTLAPQDRGLRMTAVRQLLRSGKHAEAERMLIPIVFDPHAEPATRTLMTSLLDHIRKGTSAPFSLPEPDGSADDGEDLGASYSNQGIARPSTLPEGE